jgi:LPS-assembly lipoprotein
MRKNFSTAALFLLAAAHLQGCGFRPLYSVDQGGRPGLRQVALGAVSAPDDIAGIVEGALRRRTAGEQSDAQYELLLTASEEAERLAVQIDASVTRYNYRLVGQYTLIDRASALRRSGRVVSIASFNVVNSQYSTLIAERAAREKAARQLAEDIERDILLKLAADGAASAK